MLNRHSECSPSTPFVPHDRGSVAVLGLGYVGWPVATTYAEAGFRVVGIDVAARTESAETVLVVGLTYKPGVADTRESAALAAARALAGMNRRVLVFDPLVEPPGDLEFATLADGLARATSAVLLVPQPNAIVAALLASGLNLFDATGTLAGAVGV